MISPSIKFDAENNVIISSNGASISLDDLKLQGPMGIHIKNENGEYELTYALHKIKEMESEITRLKAENKYLKENILFD